MSECASLDALPTEILHRICLHLPCSSILNICFTNRILYSACYDQLVFKRCAIKPVFQHRYNDLLELDHVDVEDWELESCASEASAEKSDDEDWYPFFGEEALNPEDEWVMDDWGPDALHQIIQRQQDWYTTWGEFSVFDALSAGDSACIAFSVEKAESYFNARKAHRIPLVNHTQWESGDFIQWFPHLLAIRHPSALYAEPESLHLLLWVPEILDVIELEQDVIGRNPSTPDFLAISFSLVTLMLLRMETVPRRKASDRLGSRVDIREPFWSQELKGYDLVSDLGALLNETWDLESYDMKTHGVPMVLWMLFFAVAPFQTDKAAPLPTLQKVPTWEYFGEVVPWKTGVEDIVMWRGDAEKLKHWMNGEWAGWYTDRRCPNGYEVMPPVTSVQFVLLKPTASNLQPSFPESSSATISGPSAETIAVIDGSSSWVEEYGACKFCGHINSDGEVRFTRTYIRPVDGWLMGEVVNTSTFRGIVTPFGIVGVWQVDCKHPHPNGFFWFWKKDWCLES